MAGIMAMGDLSHELETLVMLVDNGSVPANEAMFEAALGCGAIAILTEDCPVAVAASVMAYFDRENAGQCGSCFNGTAAMSAVLDALRDGDATADDLTRLRRWSQVLRGRGACGTLDGAVNLAGSLLSHFPAVVASHLAGSCDRCAVSVFRASRPYVVEAVSLV